MGLEDVNSIYLTKARQSGASFREHDNKLSGSIKCWEFLDQLIITFSGKTRLHEFNYLFTVYIPKVIAPGLF
jgi:hypothetical protein